MTILSSTNRQRAEALAGRVAEVAQRHGQAEIARKTEFSNNNVSRYIGGTRMPLEFGSALVDALGVNPAWLLTGQGTPYLSDVSAGTAVMAGDMLELVNAMAAVSQMRLGSLVGKHHLTVLRELSQALSRHEELRQKLNRHSEGIFRDLLEQAQAALDRRDADKAEELGKAAEQVGRLCANEDLQARLHAVLASTDYAAGKIASGLQHQRAAFLNAMLKNRGRDESVQKNAHNYAKLLIREHQLKEANRIAKAALALADGDSPHIEAVLAWMDLEFGEIGRAMSAMARLIPQLEQVYVDHNLGTNYLRAQVLAGALPLRDAVGVGASTPGKWVRLLELAILFEDAPMLERCLALGVDAKGAPTPDDHHTVRRARELQRVLRGRGKGKPETGEPAGPGAVDRFNHACWSAQLLRAAGDEAKARKLTQQAGELLAALDPESTPLIERRLVHARNQLVLLKPGEAPHTAARELLQDHILRGYRGLRMLMA
ncbi:MAG: helix-turn-helix transcriptional regulator [Planctomycetes bacterium]|nr:helix-turn-helix transcriptional regulator [Planctomycetota bacterium]